MEAAKGPCVWYEKKLYWERKGMFLGSGTAADAGQIEWRKKR